MICGGGNHGAVDAVTGRCHTCGHKIAPTPYDVAAAIVTAPVGCELARTYYGAPVTARKILCSCGPAWHLFNRDGRQLTFSGMSDAELYRRTEDARDI